jgi:hypothetical protein
MTTIDGRVELPEQHLLLEERAETLPRDARRGQAHVAFRPRPSAAWRRSARAPCVRRITEQHGAAFGIPVPAFHTAWAGRLPI